MMSRAASSTVNRSSPRVDLDRVLLQSEPVQRERTSGSACDEQMDRRGQGVGDTRQEFLGSRRGERLRAVENEIRGIRRLIGALECIGEIRRECGGIVVAMVESDPRAILVPVRGPAREENRFAGAGGAQTTVTRARALLSRSSRSRVRAT